MATIIRTKDGDRELSLMSSNGVDFLYEVIGSSTECPRDRHDGAFLMSEEDADWWERWARREQRINDTVEERGEEAEAIVSSLAVMWGHDFEVLQDMTEEALGLEAW